MSTRKFQKKISRVICMVLIACLTMFCSCIAAFARSTTVPADLTAAKLQDIIDQAAPGDIIMIPAGTYQIQASVLVNKPLFIKGNGMENTIINFDQGKEFRIMSNNVRVEGIGFTGKYDFDTNDDLAIRAFSIGNYQDFCIKNCKFTHFGYGFDIKGDDVRGVISYCKFYDTRAGAAVYGNGPLNWERPLDLGSENAVFIEDCYFENTTGVGSNNGSKYVCRYNTFEGNNRRKDQVIDAHGRENNTPLGGNMPNGSRSVEVYNNTIHHPENHYTGICLRGGDGIIFNNNINNCNRNGIAVMHGGGSEPLTPTYPGPDQTRVLYSWDNTLNGKTTGVYTPSSHADFFHEGRDYWDDYGTGDTDFNSGIFSERPASFNIGDCYWAMDINELYQCKTAGEWSLVYKPYTYPHPLAADPVIPTPESWTSKAGFSDGIHILGTENKEALLVKFDFIPNAENVNGVIGYADSDTSITGEDSFFIKLSARDGDLKAINGAAYTATNPVPYIAGQKYFVRMLVNFSAKMYSVWVTPENGTEVQLADTFAFSSTMPDDLGQICLKSAEDGDFTVIEHSVIKYTMPLGQNAEWLSKVDYANSDGLHVLGENTGNVKVEFDVIPYTTAINGLLGYAGSGTNITANSSPYFMFWLSPDSVFKVYKHEVKFYAADSVVPYVPYKTYHVRMLINTETLKYSVWVTPQGESEIQLANNYGFRVPDGASTVSIGKVFLKGSGSLDGQFGVNNHTVATETKSVDIAEDNIRISLGDTRTLTATVLPAGASNKTLEWESSNTSVATVDSSGKVTAVSAGTAVITAKVAGTQLQDTCTVTVEKMTRVTIAAPDWVDKDQVFTVILGANSGKSMMIGDISIDYNKDLLELDSCKGVNNSLLLTGSKKGTAGEVRFLFAGQGPTGAVTGNVQLVELTFKSKTVTGSAQINVTSALFLDAQGNEIPPVLDSRTVRVSIPGDLNGDNIINIKDLYVVSINYWKTSDDADWATAKVADVMANGKIDIEDLVYITTKILQ